MSERNVGRCFVASYPKSGNTWLRFIVFHLVNKRQPKSSEELDALVNSARDGPVMGSGGPFRKTHARPSAIAALMSRSVKAIHIVRHPLDVMRSAANFARLTGEGPPGDGAELDAWRAEWLEAYARAGGHPPWVGAPFFYGTWADNTSEWRSLDSVPMLRLRFEDLLQDPAATVLVIARFLEIDVGPAEIVDCVDKTSFQAMKAFEDCEMKRARELGRSIGRFSQPARLRAAESGVRFFDKGSSGSYRQAIPAPIAALAWDAMRPVAETLGYTLSRE